MKLSIRARGVGLALVGVVVIVATLSLPRLPQDPSYHRFADQRTIFGVPNALDVLSNILFAIVGLAGVLELVRGSIAERAFVTRWERWPYLVLFAGTALTAVGSSYYHLAPDNARLFWDRLPMTLGFMGLLTALLAERVSTRFARAAFVPLVLVGAASVVYWDLGEASGVGDLRPYAAVQFGSLLLILAMMIFFPARLPGDAFLWSATVSYGVAKLFEAGDLRVYGLGHIVSGHTLKHLFAALSVLFVLLMLYERSRSKEWRRGRDSNP
ncbi:MAG TPA: alkaline phytoceramidase [Thermoanaerobaculia bacterium]|nr:alkaline phytoceramidase [Thermoanaerobaculia bacterium]